MKKNPKNSGVKNSGKSTVTLLYQLHPKLTVDVQETGTACLHLNWAAVENEAASNTTAGVLGFTKKLVGI